MISDPNAFSSDAAWHFAFSNYWRVIREQILVLIALVVIDLVLALTGFAQFRIAPYIMGFPLYASAVRLVKPDFEMTGGILLRFIGLQIILSVAIGALPFGLYFAGQYLGAAPLFGIVALIIALPLTAKFSPAVPLLLLGYGTGEPISDAITGSWQAMRGQEIFEYVMLLLKMTFLITLISIVPLLVAMFALRAAGLIALLFPLLDVLNIVVSALICTMTVSFTAQLFPKAIPQQS